MVPRAIVLLLFLSLGIGCASRPHGVRAAEVQGDWFACFDETCSRVDDGGLRLREDGVYVFLQCGRNDAGELKWCCEAKKGTWTLDRGDLVVRIADREERHSIQPAGDRLTIAGRQATRMRLDTVPLLGDCGK